ERTNRIGNLSAVMYHWRATAGSVAASTEAKGDIGRIQISAVQAQLDRLRLPAFAGPGSYPHRVCITPKLRKHHPKVSIIIPTRDAPEVLEKCLSSIVEKTSYPNY